MMRGRIARELEEIENNNTDGLFAYQDPLNWSHVIAVVKGPADSPYQERYFKLDVEYPHDYPFKALKIKFCTEVWHPHVNPETGVFDSSSLYTNWTPACALMNCLIVAQSMLHAPVIIEPADTTNPEAAISYVADLAIFEQQARFWTEVYALTAPPSEEEVTQWFAASQASVKPPTPPTPPRPTPTVPKPNDSLPASALLLPVEFTRVKPYGARPFSDGQRKTVDNPIVSIPSPPSDAQLEAAIMKARMQLLELPSISARRICHEKEVSEVTVPQGKALSTSPPVPPSWLALQLEGHTSPAFIALCEQKLIQEEGFSSAELLSMVPESEFTCYYLSSIGITARGLKISLMVMHRELRTKYKVAEDAFAEDVVAAANARIAALETENANLKAQLEDKQGKQTRTVSFAESVEGDDGFVQVDLV